MASWNWLSVPNIAFATEDVELALSHFVEDGEYDQCNGQVVIGHVKIREVLVPLLALVWGRYASTTSWSSRMNHGHRRDASMILNGKPVTFDGIDVVYCRDGKQQRRKAYTKARRALPSSECKQL